VRLTPRSRPCCDRRHTVPFAGRSQGYQARMVAPSDFVLDGP
jgi:hypothetical protein